MLRAVSSLYPILAASQELRLSWKLSVRSSMSSGESSNSTLSLRRCKEKPVWIKTMKTKIRIIVLTAKLRRKKTALIHQSPNRIMPTEMTLFWKKVVGILMRKKLSKIPMWTRTKNQSLQSKLREGTPLQSRLKMKCATCKKSNKNGSRNKT